MNVTLLAGHLDDRCGSAIYNRELALRLAQRGHAVSVIAFGENRDVASSCTLYALRDITTDVPLLWRFAAFRRNQNYTRQLAQLEMQTSSIVIGLEHLLLRGHRRRFPSIPWIYLPHSLEVGEEIQSYGLSPVHQWLTVRAYRQIQRWALRDADRTVRFTQQAMKVLEQKHDWNSVGKGCINPIGVTAGPTTPTKSRNPSGHLKLLAVGRLVASKDWDVAIRAAADLESTNWSLDVLGDGPQLESLRDLVRRLGCEQNIHFHGHQENCTNWYESADLMLFPSRLESLGLVVLEAMSHGVPALAIRPDGRHYRNVNDEIIENGTTGWLVSNKREFAAQLRWASENQSALTSLGEAAQSHVTKRHSWNAHLECYESLFEELTSRKTLGNR